MTIAEHQSRVKQLLAVCEQRHQAMGKTGSVDCNECLSPAELSQLLESMRFLTKVNAPIPVG